MSDPDHSYEVYVRCSPDEAWRALVDGEQTVHYYFGTRVESDWQPGSAIRYLSPTGEVVADGEVVAIDEPHRLEMTFHPRWDPQLEAEGPVLSTWLLDEVESLTRVRIEYRDLDPGGHTYPDFVEGTPMIVSGMKTLLETGTPMTSP